MIKVEEKIYVAQSIAPVVGETATGYATTATSSAVAGQIIGQGVAGATHGIVLGQDPMEAFIAGGVGSAVSAGLGSINGFTELPKPAQAVIGAGLATSLTGQEITPEIITNAILKSTITKDVVEGYTSTYGDLDDSTLAILTDSIQSTASAAFTGGNVTDEVINGIMQQGINQFKTVMQNLKDTGTLTGVKDSYDALQETATSITDESALLQSNITSHNNLINELNPRFTERDRLYNLMESARINDTRDPTADTRKVLNDAIIAYNNYSKQLNDDYYNNYQSKINDYKNKIDASNIKIKDLETTYADEESNLYNESGQLDEAVAPIYSVAEKIFTLGMDETFNPDEYASLNNLSEDQDPYYHWLTIGKNDGLHTNNSSYQTEYNQKKATVLQNALAVSGLDLSNLTKEQILEGLSIIQNQSDGKIEGLNNINITELGTNIGSNYLSMNPLNQTVDTGDKLTLEDLKDKIVGVASILNPIKPAGASELDIANGNAVVSINSDGGLEFKVLDPFAQWDNASGQKVIKEFKRPTFDANGYYTVKDENGNILDSIEILNPKNFTGDGETISATEYAEYFQSLGFETVDLNKPGPNNMGANFVVPIGFETLLDPTQTYIESEEGGGLVGLTPEGSNIAGQSLADTFEKDPITATNITAGLSEEVKDTINAAAGAPVWDFAQAIQNYVDLVQPDVPFAETEIAQNIGTEITQSDVDALNNTIANIQGQESDEEGTNTGESVGEDADTEEDDGTGVDSYLGTIQDYQDQIDNLLGQITGLEGTIGEQTGTIGGLEGTIGEQEGTIAGLEGTIGEQTGTITGQQSSISEYLGTIGGLQDEITGLESTIGEQEGTIGGLEGTIGEQEGTIGSLEGTIGEQEGTIGEQAGALTGLGEYIGGAQQKFKDFGTAQQLQALLQPTIVSPAEEKDPNVADIGTPYDFSSIFASPEQEAKFVRPYNEINDELLKLIRGENK